MKTEQKNGCHTRLELLDLLVEVNRVSNQCPCAILQIAANEKSRLGVILGVGINEDAKEGEGEKVVRGQEIRIAEVIGEVIDGLVADLNLASPFEPLRFGGVVPLVEVVIEARVASNVAPRLESHGVLVILVEVVLEAKVVDCIIIVENRQVLVL